MARPRPPLPDSLPPAVAYDPESEATQSVEPAYLQQLRASLETPVDQLSTLCAWCGVAHFGGPEHCNPTIERKYSVEVPLIEVPPAVAPPAPTYPEDLEDDYKVLPERPDDEPQFEYIAGDAGTGKSWTVRQRANDYTDAILLATTGIAAINIGGTTINSALRYADTASMILNYELGQITVALNQLAESGYRKLIVDEISMMDGRQLDILCLAVDDWNEKHPDKFPFGIILTGDFAQLPPVGSDKKGKAGYDGTIFPFEAENWQRFADSTITLTEIKRQADPDFIRAIQQLRKGDKKCVDYFRPLIKSNEADPYDGTTILSKNDEVDRYNAVRMLRLDTPIDTYTAVRLGDPKDQPKEWRNIPETLFLKSGCLVMILANAYDEDRNLVYANGDLGTFVRRLTSQHAEVKLKRNDRTVIVTMSDRVRLKPGVPRNRRRNQEYKPGDIIAQITYMPLRVAYASTVHKSQGLSLDSVQLLIHGHFWLSAGMLYVAMSRARTPQGLRIVGTPEQFVARVRTNPKIEKWL